MAVDMRPSVQNPTALVDALMDFALPGRYLPLCPDRRPFDRLPRDLVAHVAEEAILVPERRGRLTDAVRHVQGKPASQLDHYTVIEAHIDLTELDDRLAQSLIAAGFEPDDFALMQPAQYRHHLTQQFVCGDQADTAKMHEVLMERSAAAARLIDEHPTTSGYLETEVYRSEYSAKFTATELSLAAVDLFPTHEFCYEHRQVPRSATEARATGLPIDVRRAADIHIKIPGGFLEYTHEPPEDRLSRRLQERSPAECDLVRRLADAGFYEIVSQAGNFLLSAHFAEMAEANRTFRILAEFAAGAGRITGLVREACTSLWRKSFEDDSELLLAEVPPLLRGSWSSGRPSATASDGQ